VANVPGWARKLPADQAGDRSFPPSSSTRSPTYAGCWTSSPTSCGIGKRSFRPSPRRRERVAVGTTTPGIWRPFAGSRSSCTTRVSPLPARRRSSSPNSRKAVSAGSHWSWQRSRPVRSRARTSCPRRRDCRQRPTIRRRKRWVWRRRRRWTRSIVRPMARTPPV